MTEKSPSPPLESFETALAELETLVETLEKGELPLDESLQKFERGIQLTRTCQEALKQAEQRVQQLSALDPEADLEPLPDDR